MSREVLVAWDGTEVGLRHQERITSLEQLDSVLDSIELSALVAGCVYQVDLRLSRITIGDPIMIQFLIGHPERSSLLWHEDGTTQFAVQDNISCLKESLMYKRFGNTNYSEPQFTMISYSVVRDALTLYLLLDRRPESINWIEAELD